MGREVQREEGRETHSKCRWFPLEILTTTKKKKNLKKNSSLLHNFLEYSRGNFFK